MTSYTKLITQAGAIFVVAELYLVCGRRREIASFVKIDISYIRLLISY